MNRVLAIPIPSKSSGYLARQCPKCDRRFEINHVQFEKACYLNLRCPYCEWIEEGKAFVTAEQAEYAYRTVEAEGTRMAEAIMNEMLEDLFSGFESSDFSEVEKSGEVELPEPEIPSPSANFDTVSRTCEDCGFEASLDPEYDLETASCPVCRN